MFELTLKVDGLPKIGNPFKRKDVIKGSYPVEGISIDALENYFSTWYNGKAVFSTETAEGAVKSYRECPPLTTILTRKALAFNNGIWQLKEKKKDGRIIEQPTHPLIKLFNQPNPILTGKQFRAQVETIAQLNGVCCVLNHKVEPIGFKSDVQTQHWILPPQFLTITWNKNYFVSSIADMIDKVEFGLDGNKQPIPKEAIYFFTDITTGLEGTPLPQSRLHSQQYVINNIIQLHKQMNFVIENRGAQGILSNTGKDALGAVAPLDDEELKRLQKDYKNRYNLSADKWQLIITNQPVQYQNMSYSPKELMISEFMQDSLKTLCDAMAYPYPLLADGSDAKYNNSESFGKKMYQDGIIPEADNFKEQYNELCEADKFGLEWVVDFSHLEVLQGDKEKEATIDEKTFKTAKDKFTSNSINYDRFLELCNEKDGYKGWKGKYFSELSTEEQALFNVNTNTNNNGQK
mgnify:CR=1 FL=1